MLSGLQAYIKGFTHDNAPTGSPLFIHFDSAPNLLNDRVKGVAVMSVLGSLNFLNLFVSHCCKYLYTCIDTPFLSNSYLLC